MPTLKDIAEPPRGSFEARVAEVDPAALRSRDVEVLELNVGLRCTLRCAHCHVDASPARTETMSPEVFEAAMRLADSLRPRLVDLTGGAPELHPAIGSMVDALVPGGHRVQLRTNLVSLLEPEADGLAEHLADRHVSLLASLPSTVPDEVDDQRGPGVWARGIDALRLLNALGYGTGRGPSLDLVVNVPGDAAWHEPAQVQSLFRESLGALGISFGRTIPITNVAIGRHGALLGRAGRAEAYTAALRARFNPATLEHLGCRTGVVVAWDGRIWDCDFCLGAGAAPRPGTARHVGEPDVAARVAERLVAYGEHCWACTAGPGSS